MRVGSGRADGQQKTTTFDNGFVAFWVPSDISGTIRITAEGKAGSTEFSTKSDGPTCVTDLQLQ
ncbi:CueP family metal-binding protein [Brevibacterium limosum]|uniref:CueP family metal-binding protein n=1 Tax=Brevibacterium limosum TaxID=2697565 RepID=UPI001D183561|nr:CueP family metal-binding protein [Brevibacterium limosum]